jgi:DNA polymerase III epsilon subunit-like protein
MPDNSGSWRSAELVALDLEGTGPQDPDGEAILEIALVSLAFGQPDVGTAFSTLLNPGRRIQRRPWISPGIADDLLGRAPSAEQIASTIAGRLKGKLMVGHNIRVDWRLLHKHFPDAAPAGLIDTLRLARFLNPKQKSGHSLTAWIERLDLTDAVNQAADGSRPHRALWDTIAAALLLEALATELGPDKQDLVTLKNVAGVPMASENTEAPVGEQPTLWG